jgi:hypothetical protein
MSLAAPKRCASTRSAPVLRSARVVLVATDASGARAHVFYAAPERGRHDPDSAAFTLSPCLLPMLLMKAI